ncbi:uncharacterized protein LOC131016752 [Salvia miltiorrhiza]|uniref:uncharacterized protein LOC131016752 n=1 Tax=Salvia miltiorrhiza TaxID=226208 RepID=UPI0025AC2CC6|nr:uncharacterized protein LOC131016752 [Salvia miltiorrhiza]
MDAEHGSNYVYCRCEFEGRRLQAPRITSWTDDNPGRRFYGCRNWRMKNCGFFVWYDEPMCERAREVINYLKNENMKLLRIYQRSASPLDVENEIDNLWNVMEGLKEESRKVRRKNTIVVMVLIVSWLMIGYVVLA